ncbi:hypothetical protein SAMN05216474_1776 [Lishizhenia tianjinensis]|uniref:Secretion system C-terminal sorting domain-containing protein n=1 Tax=Lishizhenia tianjinensis TaxID=477690 RepID=A0A1I7A059_9FLAO|nr:alkaline phosphatase PhoX [Lishizhenia tianjinensis]SFT68281.1 hypothetical protein SAMN05216474_1776 [Lishizhenia tianjinensis]
MKKTLLLAALGLNAYAASAQFNFDPEIDPSFTNTTVVMPASPLSSQVIFIGGYDSVATTATYGNAAGMALSKSWNDFIGFTPDPTGNYLGWLSVNHERIESDDKLGDGGGMTVFAIRRDANTDSIQVVNQTLSDGRSGKFFNVDFVNYTGETGMNCGGISSIVDGRIWTAEEWWQSSNEGIANRDTSDFTIGTGTANGQISDAGFPGYNGQTIKKYQNLNYMTEIDPREARAIRKQYNWGRQPFEGGTVMPDNKTVYLAQDATPAFFTKFVADVAGDFTSGNTYVFKEDAANPWIEIDNSNLDNMLNLSDLAIAAGATMYNRLEWVAQDPNTGLVYITETGRDNPAGAWSGAHNAGGTFAAHHVNRATNGQGTTPDAPDYWDYYGRVLQFDPTNNEMSVFIEAGPYFANSPDQSAYPSVHLSNPDGLNFLHVNGKSYMLICEDLNGTSHGRVPNGISNRTCELYLFDMEDTTPDVSDLIRISVVPEGAEITGAVASKDGKTIFVNSQHPATTNPFPYNHSLTYAITGWDQLTASLEEMEENKAKFDVYPNPVSQTLNFKVAGDFALYNAQGQRMRVYRNVQQIDVSELPAGIYYVQNDAGTTQKIIVTK